MEASVQATSFLIPLNGPRIGSHYPLQDYAENRIGRGLECQVVLSDPLCSRVHAVVERRTDEWWLVDAKSRNGTYLDGAKVEEARLFNGSEIRVGSLRFQFVTANGPPQSAVEDELGLTQTIVRDQSVLDNFSSGSARLSAASDELLLLYELSVKLLGINDPDEVISLGLELLQGHTGATIVGFLWLSDDGQLKPKLVIPSTDPSKIRLSDHLTQQVCTMGKAIWIDNQSIKDASNGQRRFADALCAPLMQKEQVIGAIHAYLEQGRFAQKQFEMTIGVARILGVALVRAREQAILREENRRLAAKSAVFDELVGESRPMVDLKSRLMRISRATGCVLIRGESGSGKELVARAIHRASPRADRPMLSVNCAAIPRELMESQLFGHKRGAFTGAESDHRGWFEQANSGTLFLDEVGEMTLDGQAKLLRILEGHPFLPVGATKEISVDVRILAATNRDLSEFVREGRFREDLYYRLSVFELFIPPLRERGPDIERLIDYFLDHFSRYHGRTNLSLSASARTKLLQYPWPGNVRQLRNVIDSAVVMAEGTEILPEDLGIRDRVGALAKAQSTLDSSTWESLRVEDWEKKLILEALRRCENKVPEAAKLLGLGRATLYRKLDEYQIGKQ